MQRRTKKQQDLLRLFFWLAIIVLLNYIGSFYFKRFDLTSEKRYSLSGATKELVKGLEDVVFIRVYLEGDLQPGFKRLRDATEEILAEFHAYSDMIEYEFINPSESPDEKTRFEVYEQLSKKGLIYTNVEYREGGEYSEKIIFPGAILGYREQEMPLQILKSRMGAHPEVMLNNSIQQLEYGFASAIVKLVRQKREKIAFIEGHGELGGLETADIMNALSGFYTIKRVRVESKLKALEEYDAIVIAKPDSAFSDKDKFIIDQFIMKGGKALWLLEGVHATMDSLQNQSTTMALPLSFRLEDQLFKYGVRINPNLTMDLQALPIPIVTGYIGNQPKQKFYPWYYAPLLFAESNHPIVTNLDAVKTMFASTIDTVSAKGVKKTILLSTSQYTKLVNAPTRVSLNVLREPPDERQYTKSHQAIAVLLEGEFESVFKNRLPPDIEQSTEIGFREKSVPTKMVVISDGDIIRNEVRAGGEYAPLGYDRYTGRHYGNKDFILNVINYLCDDSGLIEARSKEVKLRLLDRQRIDREKARWQALNTAVPVLLILLWGVAQYYLRRRKYTITNKE